jgi:pyridoxamine 5'-phosphate oxidase-like protein
VKARLPRAARDVLEGGPLCHLAVRTSRGPHLTPVVFVLDGGRIWLTTSRTSAKARALRRDPEVAGMVRMGDKAVSFRGRARTYDALDPLSWPSAAVAGPRLVRAATRFSLKNARFFAGYAVDARRVPLAWTPPGRVFVGIELDSGALLDMAEGTVADVWGDWTTGSGRIGYRASFANLGARRGLDVRVPASIRSIVGTGGEGALALGHEGATVVPVRWRGVAREGTYDAVLPQPFLDLVEPATRGGRHPRRRAALTVDRLAAWRAAEMTGMLLQGDEEVFSPTRVRRGSEALSRRIEGARTPRGSSSGESLGWKAPDLALVRLRPLRVVWWQGWSTGSVSHP